MEGRALPRRCPCAHLDTPEVGGRPTPILLQVCTSESSLSVAGFLLAPLKPANKSLHVVLQGQLSWRTWWEGHLVKTWNVGLGGPLCPCPPECPVGLPL